MKSRAQAIADLSRVVSAAVAISSRLTPQEAAERAWHPGGPSIPDLAERIAANRERLALAA